MLRPRRMSRVVVAGARIHLDATVETLHGAGTFHITGYHEQYPGYDIGAPAIRALELSEKKLALRSAVKILGVEEDAAPKHKLSSGEASARLEGLLQKIRNEVTPLEEERHRLDSSLKDIERRKMVLSPFAGLALNLEDMRPYGTLSVFTGTIKSPIGEELEAVTGQYELFQSGKGDTVALFVDRRRREDFAKLLASKGFSELKVPEGEGLPADILRGLSVQETGLKGALAALAVRIATERSKYKDELLACTEELSVRLEKDEAPLHFAVTKTAFIIEGWVPSAEVDKTENLLLKATRNGIHLERLEEREWMAENVSGTPAQDGKNSDASVPGPAGKNGEAGKGPPARKKSAEAVSHSTDDPYATVPIALSNPRPVKPFETLMEMFSLPNYKEIDPTMLLALVFPFFFGMMIGDMGYGILLMITGVVFRKKLKKYEGFSELGAYLIAGGLFAALFGAFVFADCFGIPFNVPPAGEGHGAAEICWSALLGVHIPINAMVHKLESSGLSTLLIFSVVAGIIHLCLGNILGIINSYKHSKRHALGKAGWLLIVLGFGLLILKFGEPNVLGAWLWAGPLSAFSASWDIGISGVLVPYASIAFLLAGLVMAAAGEGVMVFIELFGVLSSILSYTRLAAIGVAKGAMAFAFNSLFLPLVVGGDPALAVAGFLGLLGTHFLVFALGGLSAGIQALRLNLVEFLMKFYKGGGIKFTPFGYRRKYTTESE